MDPRHLFFDRRHLGGCGYCGSAGPLTGDHVPSKVLLDEPLPTVNVQRVPACSACNGDLSKDELYLACLLECAAAGTTDPEKLSREKVRRNLVAAPKLVACIEDAQRATLFGTIEWEVKGARVRRVALKLARGHAYIELGEPACDEPSSLTLSQLHEMPPAVREAFESPQPSAIWPEVGSRAFVRAANSLTGTGKPDGWVTVQPGRYRYCVGVAPTEVRVVLSEYLAVRASWETEVQSNYGWC